MTGSLKIIVFSSEFDTLDLTLPYYKRHWLCLVLLLYHDDLIKGPHVLLYAQDHIFRSFNIEIFNSNIPYDSDYSAF